MSKSSHTPGPWPAKMTGDGKRIVIGDGLVDGPGGYEVAEVYSDDCDRDEAWANAHLIAAAPDLYAALEALRHAVCGETGFAACVRADSGKAYPWPALDDAEALVNAALAKARGEA